ncbi:unnamed protein product [Ceutorhynchus assimilis]|uniref:Prominin-1-A n=1 Tax=Ceutorhynchus assimilis TaxID=467358 RepID=A0A9P0DDI2_9CUCU|nr:unnamed protein product [Ceutorhynchus assimilis]
MKLLILCPVYALFLYTVCVFGDVFNDRNNDLCWEGLGKSDEANMCQIKPFRTDSAISIRSEQQKVKELRNDNLTRHTIQNFRLQFLDIPTGDDLKIHELQLENELLLFEAFSGLMGYLLPGEFPIGAIRNAFRDTDSSHLWIFQVIKLEILVVLWIIFWAILSLCLPVGVMVFFCFPTNMRRLNEELSNDSLDGTRRTTEQTLGRLLHVLLILMLFPVILILAGNEEISKSISKAPLSVTTIYDDITTFIRNSNMQISFITTSSTDIALEAIRKELEDGETFLGQPYQQQLTSETGLDMALASLGNLKNETSKVSSIVSDLLGECETAKKAGKALQDEIQEMTRQLVAIQQQCTANDRPLCFTIQFSGFDITLPLNNLTTDSKIHELDRIKKNDTLNKSIDAARKRYSNIPGQLVHESTAYIADIKSLLSRKRTDVYKSTHELDVLARTLTEEVNVSQKAIFTILENAVKWDLWRWLVILGGHGRSFICHPLYDHPNYGILGEFLDRGGILYEEPEFFFDFSSENDSVKIANVLNGCQRDQTAYQTFHIQNKFPLNKKLNYKTWDDLNTLMNNFTKAKFEVEILSTSLQINLQKLSLASAANLTDYRLQISSSISRWDLASFSDQLNSVGRQLEDTVIIRKMDNLAFSMRKLVQTEMQRLNDLRGRILYKITSLEVLLPTLNAQVNQSLSQLETIQIFLDNQGSEISQKVKRQFTDRIENHLEELYSYTTKKVTKEIGKCRPIWEIFHAGRFHVCKLIFDPLNAIAFASFFLILVFIATTPIVVKLIDIYQEGSREGGFSYSHRESRAGLLSDDDRIWTSPSSGSSLEEREMINTLPTTWISPPPRPPTVASHVQPTRNPQPPTITYTRSSPRPRSKLSGLASRITGARSKTPQRRETLRETLRLIEPIHWKSGSTTPRSWI